MALDFPNNPNNGDVYPYTYTVDLNGTTFFREVDYVYSAAKDSWTGTITKSSIISVPEPSDVVASPPFSNAAELDAGTEGNPYKLNDQIAPTPGMTLLSGQQIIFTGQTAGQRIYFQDESQHSNTRFQQDLLFLDGYGSASTRLKYTDEPVTPQEGDGTPYTAKIKAGKVWFEWQVTQQVAQPIDDAKQSTIAVSGNSWTVGQTVTMSPGQIEGGVIGDGYKYEYTWQRSVDGSNWENVMALTDDISVLDYPLTVADIGLLIRGVTVGTDSTTPTNQVLVMNSNNSPNPINGAPQISEARLGRTSQSDINRYNDQTYTVYLSYFDEGYPGVPENSLSMTFQLPNQALRYGVLDSAGNVTAIVDTGPTFTKQDQLRNINLKFPVSFADGSTPDQLLPEGTSMIVTASASNTLGTTSVNSNSVLPELGDVVSFPTPNLIGSAFTGWDNPDPFVAKGSPFNDEVGALGSNKLQYGLGWANETSISFTPTWDVSNTPIAKFQGGGVEGGLDDFLITFTDPLDNTTSVVVNTSNNDWSAPISFSDYGFTPPTSIKRITFRSYNSSNSEVGLVGFYEADDTPVIYETITTANTRLAAKKVAAINSIT